MSNSAQTLQGLLSDPLFPDLKTYLLESTGLAYYADKDPDLAGRIGRRMQRVGAADCQAYLEVIRGGGSELDALIASLTIGETYFFRDRDQFDALRDIVFPDLIERNEPRRRLRIWSAGCATGPEPYSVAILLKRELGHRLHGWTIDILGTDINQEFLARARDGRFDSWALRSINEDVKDACFRAEGGSWVLRPPYREGVSFQYHNLVRHQFPSLVNNLAAFDLILCRNVRIYFSSETGRRLVHQFHESLAAGGWLLVGHAEHNPEFYRQFRAVSTHRTTLYQKALGGEQPFPPLVVSPRPETQWVANANRPSGPLLDEIEIPSSPPSPTITSEAQPPVVAQRSGTDSGLEEVRRLADGGRWEEATRRCGELMNEHRLSPQLHYYLALVMDQMGRHEESEASLRRTIYLDRGSVLAHYHLGLLRQKRGQTSGAIRSFENVLELLAPLRVDRVLDEADGLSVANLKELAEMQLEVLGGL